MKKHLAIFSKEEIEEIFSGEKTFDSRFSKKRISPFGMIGAKDIVYIKPPGQDIVGQFRVKKVISIEGLEESDWEMLEKKFKISKEKKQNLKFLTLIFLTEVEQFITSPIKITKKDLRGWAVL